MIRRISSLILNQNFIYASLQREHPWFLDAACNHLLFCDWSIKIFQIHSLANTEKFWTSWASQSGGKKIRKQIYSNFRLRRVIQMILDDSHKCLSTIGWENRYSASICWKTLQNQWNCCSRSGHFPYNFVQGERNTFFNSLYNIHLKRTFNTN